MSNRQGFSLAELLVGLVVASLVSASIVQLMVVQSRFMTTQEGRANARAVSRGALVLVESDLRMVQTSAGVVAAAADSITIRVPFAIGVVCDPWDGGSTVIMVPPVDSLIWADDSANVAGYGWRDSNNTLTWFESSSMSIPNDSDGSVECTDGLNPLTPFPGTATRYKRIPFANGSYRGAAVFLHQRITYRFEASASVPGRIGLYRRRWRASPNSPEEIVAPFDASANFQFYTVGSTTASSTPPADLNDLRGIELNLVGVNERAPAGSAAELSPLRTAVFFKN